MVYTKTKWKNEDDLKLGHHRDSTVEGFTWSQLTQIEEERDGGKWLYIDIAHHSLWARVNKLDCGDGTLSDGSPGMCRTAE